MKLNITVKEFKNLDINDKLNIFESRTKRKTSKVRSLIYAVGYLDVSFPVAIKIEGRAYYHPAYSAWQNMLKRCYYTKNTVSYTPAVVCDEWLRFSNFLAWWKNNYVPGLELDKDQECLMRGLKVSIYSPETCRYIPKWLNLIFRRKSDGSLREIRQAA
ncbi:hypothetical protein [Aeromonas media]|uniref:hypothetical protein n=1 Tax=Aeromonas media TaxID=651 RepID=UPI0024C10F07|nr:hypothetical protein [Aeromonas media]MDM5075951.1 hypothetical protein [Aeromonas media]MDX7900356.1 hypothetical protein [Aeromonas media]